jgi:SWI/SNF-related matrix-associated actin-dependent regulator 1 of chromatin subfamily A
MGLQRNAFPGTCEKCNGQVKAQAGYRQRIDGRWAVWCEDHAPGEEDKKPSPVLRKITKDGVILWPFNREELDLVRSFPCARFIGNGYENWVEPVPGYKEGYWTCSTLAKDRNRVLELANKLKLSCELKPLGLSAQAKLAKSQGAYDFQVEGVDFLSKQDKAVLGDDMGLGKTVQTLLALPKKAKAVIVVPNCVKLNWSEECQRWRPDLKPVVLKGRNSFRFPESGEVVILNYEILPAWLECKYFDCRNPNTGKHYKAESYEHYSPYELRRLSETILIVDEVHKVKNYKAQRSRRIKGLSKHCKKGWYLSGTPLINRPLDLWGVLSAIDLERVVFKGFKHFIQCFNGFPNGYGGYEFGDPVAVVPELLRRIMLRRKRETVLPDLPSKTYSKLVVDASASLNKKMDKLMDEFGEFLEGNADWVTQECLDGDATLEDIDRNVKLPPFERFSKIRAELANNRVAAALEYVEDCEEQDVPLIVFSAHKNPVKKIAERDGWACITGDTPAAERQRLVNEFQAGNLKGLACTIIAAGVGLTLTRAWKALFIDLDWTPANNWQAEDRICRIGQESNTCEIIRMVSSHVLEQHLHNLLAWKVRIIQAAIDDSIEVNPQPVDEVARQLVATVEAKETDWLTDSDPDLPF